MGPPLTGNVNRIISFLSFSSLMKTASRVSPASPAKADGGGPEPDDHDEDYRGRKGVEPDCLGANSISSHPPLQYEDTAQEVVDPGNWRDANNRVAPCQSAQCG